MTQDDLIKEIKDCEEQLLDSSKNCYEGDTFLFSDQLILNRNLANRILTLLRDYSYSIE